MQSCSLRQLVALFMFVTHSSQLLGAPSTTSESMTLQGAVQYAMAHSPRLAKAEAEAGIRGLEEENARARLFPSLDLSATHGLEKSLPQGPVAPNEAPVVSQLALTLTQPIYDNGETSTRREIAKVNREVAELGKAKARDDLILEVARAFYRLSLTDILLTIKQRQQDLLSKQFRLTESAYKQGLRTKKDFLRMQSETQRSRVSAEEGVARRAEAEIALLQLMGREPPAGPVTFATITAEQALGDKLSFPDKLPDVKQSYSYRAHEASQRVTAQSIELVRRKNSPEITLGAGASYANANYLNSEDPYYAKDSVSWNLLLGIKYNIWDAGSRRRDIDIALAQGQVSDLSAEAELQALEGQMRSLMATLFSLKSSHALNQELLELEETSYRYLESEYRQGRVAYLDLITALSDLLSARVGYYSTHIDTLQKLAEYRYYEGTIHAAFATP